MSAAFDNLAIPLSILDTDLYKVCTPRLLPKTQIPMQYLTFCTHNSQLTMQQAVLQQFPDVPATYRFTNRNASTLFSRQSIERFRTAISGSCLASTRVRPTPNPERENSRCIAQTSLPSH